MFRRSFTFINVTVLTAAGPIGHALRVTGSRIAAIDTPPQKRDVVIDGQGSLLIPGLINAHDHLELNTFQRIKYRERYSHSVQWIEDIEARFDTNPELVEPRRQPLADRLLIGAVKNLLSGVTTVCHHNPLHRPLRYNYPIRVVKNYGFCHSLFRGDDPETSYHQTKANYPWIIHLAEGCDDAARQEFEQLDRAGLVQPNTVLVHGVGLTPSQRHGLIERGGGLVWCPGSNLFMLGETAQVGGLAEAGKLALGSDSRLSGEGDLLAELRVAAATHQLSAAALFRTVTLDAARLLRIRQAGVGNLEVGGAADLILLPSPGESSGVACSPPNPPKGGEPDLIPPFGGVGGPESATDLNPPPREDILFSAIHQQTRATLNLVMLAGNPLVGAESMQPVFDATNAACQNVQVDGVSKLMHRKLVNRLRRMTIAEPGLTW